MSSKGKKRIFSRWLKKVPNVCGMKWPKTLFLPEEFVRT